MIIKTKEFNTSKAEFRHVINIAYYRSIKDLIIGLASFTIIIVFCSGFNSLAVSIAIWSGILLGYLLIFPFLNTSAKSQPGLHLKNRTCEITDNYFSMTFEDGSLTKVHFNNYLKINRESEWYFLYMTQVMFEYLPLRAFNSEKDINEFETMMKNKKLME
ncbi:MAG: YcxB family protein [Chroococcus sp. CMT-3BRIN-NPC107]|jgi:hypothetical protein|nr:YcxB family protein [Chroococcus sp. CMT-3BRIN-NPC107]